MNPEHLDLLRQLEFWHEDDFPAILYSMKAVK